MQGSVLKRKAGRGQPAALAEMTTARALRLALAKAAEAGLGVPVTVRNIAEARRDPEALEELLPDPGLYVALSAAGGLRGLAVLCPQAVAAAVEARTMGRVTAAPAQPRKATATDAAMVAGWLDRALAGAAALAAERSEIPEGAVCGPRLSGPRGIGLALAELPHLEFRAELDFAGGAKAGTLWLILPEPTALTPPEKPDGGAWHARLERTVLGTSARLDAVLCRMRLPLERIVALAPGDSLPLGQATVDDVVLTGADGREVAGARLGRSGAVRAVRLRVGPARKGIANSSGAAE